MKPEKILNNYIKYMKKYGKESVSQKGISKCIGYKVENKVARLTDGCIALIIDGIDKQDGFYKFSEKSSPLYTYGEKEFNNIMPTGNIVCKFEFSFDDNDFLKKRLCELSGPNKKTLAEKIKNKSISKYSPIYFNSIFNSGVETASTINIVINRSKDKIFFDGIELKNTNIYTKYDGDINITINFQYLKFFEIFKKIRIVVRENKYNMTEALEILDENDKTIGILMPCRPQHDCKFLYICGRKHWENSINEASRIFEINFAEMLAEQYDIEDKVSNTTQNLHINSSISLKDSFVKDHIYVVKSEN